MATAAQIAQDLDTKRRAFASWIESNPIASMTTDQITEFNARNDELGELGKAFDQADAMEKAAARIMADLAPAPRAVAGEQPGQPEAKAGPRDFDRVLHDSGYHRWAKAARQMDELTAVKAFPLIGLTGAETKTAIALSGIAPNPDRQEQITGYPAAFRPVEDLLLPGSTESNTVTYYEETAETDNTAARTEGSAVTDNAMTFTLRTDTVRAITTWIPVTLEALKDVQQLESFLTVRLPFLLSRKTNSELINADATGVRINGLLNRTNIQTQAKGADTAIDAIFKAMVAVNTTGDAVPTGIIMAPVDWQGVRLLKTADGRYIFGDPAGEAMTQLWGLDVRVTPQLSAGTAIVGAFKPHAQVFRNGGVTFQASTEHSDFFTTRQVALLAENRLTLACYRGQAICKVTGL